MSDDEIEVIKEIKPKQNPRTGSALSRSTVTLSQSHQQQSSPCGFTLSSAHHISRQEFSQIQHCESRQTKPQLSVPSIFRGDDKVANHTQQYPNLQAMRVPQKQNPPSATGTAIINTKPLSLSSLQTNPIVRSQITHKVNKSPSIIPTIPLANAQNSALAPKLSLAPLQKQPTRHSNKYSWQVSNGAVQGSSIQRMVQQTVQTIKKQGSSIDRTVQETIQAIMSGAAAKSKVSASRLHPLAQVPPKPTVHPPLKLDIKTCYVRTKGWAVMEHNDDEFLGHFKCTWEECDAILPTNISFCNHLVAHLLTTPVNCTIEDDGEHDDISLEDFCRCNHCFKIMDSPKMHQMHVLHFHMDSPQAPLVDRSCFICNKHLQNPVSLQHHINTVHMGADAPYRCRQCNFMSSLYGDLHRHFEKDHNRTTKLMCPICLLTLDAVVSFRGAKRGLATSKDFVSHMMQHVERQGVACNACQFTFTSKADLQKHEKIAHRKVTSRDDVERIQLNQFGCPQSVVRPLPDRCLVNPAFKQLALSEVACVECRLPMDGENHYRMMSSTSCMVCPFKTCCNKSYEHHMYDHAKGLEATPSVFHRHATKLSDTWYCYCGFTSDVGNALAQHVAECELSGGGAYMGESPATSPEPQEDRTPVPPRLLKHLRLKTRGGQMDYADSDKEDEDMIRNKMRDILSRKDKTTDHDYKPQPQLLRSLSSPKRQLRPRRDEREPPTKKLKVEKQEVKEEEEEETEAPNDERQHLSRKRPVFVKRHCKAEEVGTRYEAEREEGVAVLHELEQVCNEVSVGFNNQTLMSADQLALICHEIVEPAENLPEIDVAKTPAEDASMTEQLLFQMSSDEVEETAIDFDEFVAESDAPSRAQIEPEEDRFEQSINDTEALYSRFETVLAS